MRGILDHLRSQIFVTATAVAAFVHSTWALAVLFGGKEPIISQPGDVLHWLAWVLPAGAIAFAIDVGQVFTADEIRKGQRTPAKYATFLVFAAATYYLQWFHLSYHMPVLMLSDGINPNVVPFALGFRDAALWIVPLLLPLSTLLYTFSGSQSSEHSESLALVAQEPLPEPVQIPDRGGFQVACPDCSWVAVKDDERSAQNALNAHQRVHRSVLLVSNGKHT